MAKKARRKLEEEEEAAFEFPAFDEKTFTTKEFELGGGLLLAGIITLAVGFATWAVTVVLGTPWVPWVPLLMGIVIIIISPFVIQRLRRLSTLYTKGDWAGLIAMEFFGWFALWFLLLNLSGTMI
jgi:hypothetical protein